MPDDSPPAPGVPDLAARRFPWFLLLIVGAAALLRLLFPNADPPWHTTVGIVWHDEGAWVHNARNRALWGSWSVDAWNPMYIAPVFTALVYASFAAFGVGLWQARLVSEFAGVLSVLLLALGVRHMAGAGAGLLAGALLATNYVFVMYNRAALMESTMVAFMVAAWYCYARAGRRSRWGAAAAACALLAFFTKAAAAFFVAALALDAVIALARRRAAPAEARAGAAIIGGFAGLGLLAGLLFILPNWTEYRFYNWQMSVTRKPSYDLRSLLDRVTWFPILHDVFSRMWAVMVIAIAAALGSLARWRALSAPERLLLWWVGLGALELVLHDVGNERRFIFFIPALIALASAALAGRLSLGPFADVSRRRLLLALPVVLFAFYVLFGGIVRLGNLYAVGPNVRVAAALAAAATVLVVALWPVLSRWLSAQRWTWPAAAAIGALIIAADLAQFVQWASHRSYKNYLASIEIGRRLPEGTLVHGKLANGLALENRIRPVFVGRAFGNYEDRRTRDDVRYILTYVAPCVGYEGAVIHDVLEAYPNRRVLMTFDVAETPGGFDRAALIDKFGGPHQAPGYLGALRACD